MTGDVNRELFNSFVKTCKKITANFSLADIIELNDFFEKHIYNKDGSINENYCSSCDNFEDVLFAMFVLKGYINYIIFKAKSKDNITNNQLKKLPNGWRVIK